MVRLTLLMALLTGSAQARCFGPTPPKLVHFDSGRTVENLGHTAQDFTYRLPNDGEMIVTTARFGIFPITSSSHGATISYTWLSDLADPRQQLLGKTLAYDADEMVEHAFRSHFHTEITRLRDDTFALADCSYPVHVITRTDTHDGKTGPTVTLWLSDMMFPLKTEVTINGTKLVYTATLLE